MYVVVFEHGKCQFHLGMRQVWYGMPWFHWVAKGLTRAYSKM